jgi:hypothetical protein
MGAQLAGDATAWWHLLSALAALNLLLWAASTAWLHRRAGPRAGDARRWLRLQALLSAVYVLGCGYRSVLPVFDVPRLVMVDSFASSVLVGRSVATLAELAFAAQWALLLAALGRATGHRPAQWAGRAVLPMIGVAELHSWAAVLTGCNLGHVVEESLWGAAAALSVAALAGLWPRASPVARRWLLLGLAGGCLYTAYMAGVDVPMYWARWQADEAAGLAYRSLGAGLADAASRWTVSHDWAHWRGEVVWMTLYFSVAVWVSIGLAHVRLPEPGTASRPVAAP